MKVRTTMQPDVEIDVSQIEAADLAAQGLLVAPEEAPPATDKALGAGKDKA